MKKKRQIIAATAILLAGAIGFAGVYSSEKARERKELESQLAQNGKDIVSESGEKTTQTSGEQKPAQQQPTQQKPTQQQPTQQKPTQQEPIQQKPTQQKPVNEPSEETSEETGNKPGDSTVPTNVQQKPKPVFHFPKDEGLRWPLEGNVVLNYSMDSTIYFPTLDQYQCNPAIVISGDVNEKVYLAASGTITDISTNEVTGCTVTQDLGDGYSAVYGQLKEVVFKKGDTVEAGQVIGYVGEPTKYFAVEGSNLYFKLLKDGEPIDPMEYLE